MQQEVIAMIEAEQAASVVAKHGKDCEYGGNWGILSSSEEEEEEYYGEDEEQAQPEMSNRHCSSYAVSQANAIRAARLQQLGAPPQSLLHATSSGSSADNSGIGSDGGDDTTPKEQQSPAPKYPAPAPVPQIYTPPSDGLLSTAAAMSPRLHGEPETSVAVQDALEHGLVFDDSWMDETCSHEMGRIGEYKEDEDVLDQLEKVAKREAAGF